MRVSYILNTAAKDARATGANPWRQADYTARYAILKDKVLPSLQSQGFDEIIVAGNFESGSGYNYVSVEPRSRDRRNALWQREVGARYSTGDILVFGHDDHALASDFLHALKWRLEDDNWDLLIPRRTHGITGATLNNGQDADYMGGHVLVMRRWLWAEVPWTLVDTDYWDVSMTREWKDAGGKLLYADELVHIDVEAAEDEE